MSDPISKPMLFSSEMIRALLDGRKTQTRRIAKEFHTEAYGMGWCEKVWQDERLGFFGEWNWRNPTTKKKASITSITPRHPVGSLIWCKETFWQKGQWFKNGLNKKGKQKWRFESPRNAPERISFDPPSALATRPEYGWYKRSSLFMPKWASRITLEVTAVKVERLNDISEEDAKAEGVQKLTSGLWRSYHNPTGYTASPLTSYETLWESINGKGSWALNNWVWAYTFRRVKP